MGGNKLQTNQLGLGRGQFYFIPSSRGHNHNTTPSSAVSACTPPVERKIVQVRRRVNFNFLPGQEGNTTVLELNTVVPLYTAAISICYPDTCSIIVLLLLLYCCCST